MRRKHIFPLAAQLHIVAAHKESAFPKYLGITGGQEPASFTSSQRFEQREDHGGPGVLQIDNIDAAGGGGGGRPVGI